MTTRDKLITLMKEVQYPAFPNGKPDYNFGTQHPDHVFQLVAIHMISNNVVIQEEGEWINGRYHEQFQDSYEEQCSACKKWSLEYGKPYCPNCGARMRG